MPSAPPDGVPPPTDGALSRAALDRAEASAFGVYLHVPFCAARCGYCDFNTYTPEELRGGVAYDGQVVRADGYAAAVRREVALAREVLGQASIPAASTVFVGGGTPTLLDPDVLAGLLGEIGEAFGLADGAEVTIEANPESVTEPGLARLREAGVNRISLGMQSAVPGVLATLDRRHSPGRVAEAFAAARSAGFDSISLDLIYGTPGESAADWEESLRTALALRPDHLSAYSLVVEPGTAMGAAVAAGRLASPDDDVAAERYEVADELCAAAGLEWYEVSNWSAPGAACRHNLGYWRSDSWWGLGPGAHSHVGGTRWWNARLPAEYQRRLEAGITPAEAREDLTDEQRHDEDVMLRIRLAEGLPVSSLSPQGRSELAALQAEGLLRVVGDVAGTTAAQAVGRVVLTRRGRLLADTVTRRLLD